MSNVEKTYTYEGCIIPTERGYAVTDGERTLGEAPDDSYIAYAHPVTGIWLIATPETPRDEEQTEKLHRDKLHTLDYFRYKYFYILDNELKIKSEIEK